MRNNAHRRCDRCKHRRPDVWLRSRWSKSKKNFVQRVLCGPCGRKLGFHFQRPKWAAYA